MRPPSAQHSQRHDIWNHQYDQPCIVFANVCVESSTTIRTAATIELATLALSLVGIRRASRHRESSLARLLKAQGVTYFAMVFFLHLTMVVSGSGSVETQVHLHVNQKIVNCFQPGGGSRLCSVIMIVC